MVCVQTRILSFLGGAFQETRISTMGLSFSLGNPWHSPSMLILHGAYTVFALSLLGLQVGGKHGHETQPKMGRSRWPILEPEICGLKHRLQPQIRPPGHDGVLNGPGYASVLGVTVECSYLNRTIFCFQEPNCKLVGIYIHHEINTHFLKHIFGPQNQSITIN